MAFNREEWTLPTPYGCTGWINLAVNFFALLFFMLSAFKCFFSVNKTDDYKVFVGYWSAESVEIAQAAGRGNDNNYCVSWDKATKEELFDGAWRFGRGIGILGSLICLPFFLLALYVLVYKVHPRFFLAYLCSTLVMAVLSILLLVGLSSNVCDATSCKMGPGGYLAILDFFLWLAAAFFAFRLLALSQSPEIDGSPDDGPDVNKEPLKALPPSENKPLPALPPSESLSHKV